tara:strand:- start:74 stop:391 length:318 start_codon:yes stop_codon:yes gene_type:complete
MVRRRRKNETWGNRKRKECECNGGERTTWLDWEEGGEDEDEDEQANNLAAKEGIMEEENRSQRKEVKAIEKTIHSYSRQRVSCVRTPPRDHTGSHHQCSATPSRD